MTRLKLTIVTFAAALAVSCSTGGRPLPAHDADLPPRKTGLVTVGDGARIYYELCGRSADAVVLIHGLGGNHAVWHKQVAALAPHGSVLTYSQRGFAPSERTAEGFDNDRLVSDLADLLDALRIDRVHLVGQSMGGWTALGFALEYPQRVRGLVLADTTAGIFDERIHTHYEEVVERSRRLASEPGRVGAHPALDAEFTAAAPGEAYLYQTLASFGSPSPARIAEDLGEQSFTAEALERLKVPTLFLVGERDPIFPVAIVKRAASYIPNARVKVLPGAGHSPYFETPSQWNEALFEALQGG